MIIGSYVRGLSDRDIESLTVEAGLGQVSKTTVSRICRELRDRYRAFCSKSLAEVSLLVLFLDAVYLPTRPSGDKEGVLVAWGYTTLGKRVLVAVRLGQRESHEDWLDLGRDLARRGLRSPWLVVSDGAPGLIKAIEELWPEADRGRCAVHKLRNIVAKLPGRPGLHEEIKRAYWAVLDELNRGCASSSRTWSGSIPAPRPAWPMICQRCVSTSSTCPVYASDCDRRISWNAHWRRFAVGPKSLVGSRVRPVV